MFGSKSIFATLAIAAAACSAAAQEGAITPEPSGRFPTGTSVLHLIDPARSYGEESGRPLVIQIWYPAESSVAARAPYHPEFSSIAEQLDDEGRRIYGVAETRSGLDAEFARSESEFPAVVLFHGLGQSRVHYTSFAEDLASHGVAVIGIETPGAAAVVAHVDAGLIPFDDSWTLSPPDISLAEMFRRTDARLLDWVADLEFALDTIENDHAERFGSKIRSDRVGALGHSLGGKAAMAACARSVRVVACANLDGWPFPSDAEVNGFDGAFLYMSDVRLATPQELEEWNSSIQEYAGNMDRLRDRVRRFFGKLDQRSYWVRVEGLPHGYFSDEPLIDPREQIEGAPLDPEGAVRLVRSYVSPFFLKQLGGDAAPELDVAVEIEVLGRERHVTEADD